VIDPGKKDKDKKLDQKGKEKEEVFFLNNFLCSLAQID